MDELEATLFTDGTWVIIGSHLTIEEAQKVYEKEDDGTVTDVDHWWVKCERISEERAYDEYDLEDFIQGYIWLLIETTKRPKGVVRKATVLTIDCYISQNGNSTIKEEAVR